MKIKVSLFALVLTCFAGQAFASNISRKCTNASGTITMEDFSGVKIITGMYAADNTRKVQEITLDTTKDISVTIRENLTIETKSGCSSSRKTSIEKITLAKLNGEKMPDAYSKNADKDGKLSDIWLCEESSSWMPSPGSCK
jgi:hypothetical protein